MITVNNGIDKLTIVPFFQGLHKNNKFLTLDIKLDKLCEVWGTGATSSLRHKCLHNYN